MWAVSKFVSSTGKTETIKSVKPQLIICHILADSLHFGACVCDVIIAPRIASTAANKHRWRELSWQDSLQETLWFEKFCVSSFWSYGKLFSQYRLQTLIFKVPAFAKLAVNTGMAGEIPAIWLYPRHVQQITFRQQYFKRQFRNCCG